MRKQVLDKEVSKQIFYSNRSLLSYNPLFAFILGSRSTGKSFEFKDWALNRTDDTLIVWIRRQREDIDSTADNWLIDLNNNGKLDADNEYNATSKGIFVNGILKVAFVALSTMAKRQSVVFELANNVSDEKEGEIKLPKKAMVFEEFIEPTGKYLKNEIELFMNFYITVKRNSRVPVYFIGNKISFVNPYFEYFHIKPFTQEFKWFKNKTVLVQNYNNEAFNEYAKQDEFSKLIEGTKFYDYLYGNDVWKDTNAFIKPIPKGSKLKWNIRVDSKAFGIWYNDGCGYVSWKTNQEALSFSSKREKREGDLPLDTKYGCIDTLKMYIIGNKLFYEDNILKEKVWDMINGGYKE